MVGRRAATVDVEARGRIFVFQAEDGIRDYKVTGVQTCALPISSSATRSMTFILSASDADRLTASRTARSAHSALRPRICARLRMYAEASFTCLRVIVLEAPPPSPFPVLPPFPSVLPSSSPPPGAPMATGVAAPRLVAGAIAAMWLA